MKQKHLMSKINFVKSWFFKNKIICVFVLLFLTAIFTLYNYYAPSGKSNPKNDASQTENTSNPEAINFSLSIEKLNLVNVPVIRGVDPTDEEKYDEALKNGVAHMVGTALPGQGSGNILIYGHSSAKDNQKFGEVFSKLDDLKFGDEIKINYNSNEYKYWISEKKFIEKDDFSVLEQTGDERVTLMTCWPIGTSDRRLVIIAKKNL